MHLKIKPIINGLFYATVCHETFSATAIGESQTQAAQRAVVWLKREIKMHSTLDSNALEALFKHLDDKLNPDKQVLYAWDFFKPDSGKFTGSIPQNMAAKASAGAALVLSTPIINATATVIGVAKTGTAIGTLHGAAHTNATAAWVGFGSMKLGMLIMGALPVVGALLILDSLCGREHGVPLIDWYEKGWRRYEAQCELDELKKIVKVDPDHRVRAKYQATSLTQLNNQFHALEVERDLSLLKKQMGLL